MVIWMLLPAYNEEKSISLLLPKLRKTFEDKELSYNIVIVNDGSSDNSLKVIEEFSNKMPINVINHKINRGLGETERDGFEYIAENCSEDDIIMRMDCDDTHEPKYILDLIQKIEKGYDVVSTSRFQPGGGQTGLNAYRRFISYSANIFMKLIFNIKGIKDYSCGYRAYRAKVIKDAISIFGNGFIQLKGLGFTSTLEMIVKLNLLGCTFSEVPFVLKYDQKASPSKMVSSVTTLGYFTMATLYHWPFGGWKGFYKDLKKSYKVSPISSIEKYSYRNLNRTPISKIGM